MFQSIKRRILTATLLAIAPSLFASTDYIKGHNTTNGNMFGFSTAISGETLVVGAKDESGDLPYSGAAYVFVNDGSGLSQQAYLKASDPGEGDRFAYSVAISGDTIAVTAIKRRLVYIFVRDGNTWTQQARLESTRSGYLFGTTLGISGDALIVDATPINYGTNQAPNPAGAFIFRRSGTSWTEEALLTPHNFVWGQYTGGAVAISGDTAVVGNRTERSSSTGINSTPNQSLIAAGAAYVFTRNGTTWTQEAYLKPHNTQGSSAFGEKVAISGDTIVVGARGHNPGVMTTTNISVTSSNTMVTNVVITSSTPQAGAAYVFARTAGTWSQQAYLLPNNASARDEFGSSVAVSGDRIVVGAHQEDGSATGINGFPNDLCSGSGAAYLFTRSGSVWTQEAYLKANTCTLDKTVTTSTVGDELGSAVAISESWVIGGAWNEDGFPAGSAPVSGAVYAYDIPEPAPAFDPNANLPMNRLVAQSLSGAHVLTFRGLPDTDYALESTPSLISPDWTAQLTNRTAQDGTVIFTTGSDAPQIFYRVRLVP